MRVKAIKVEQGILIPYQEGLTDVQNGQLFLDIELVDAPLRDDDYKALDDLVGLCETGDATASIEHDKRIYRR